MKVSRSEYIVKNVSVALVMQIIKNVLAFVGRTIFVKVLGTEYLGVNGLFTEILTLLSFAELGIGNAMVFSLYKPLAEEDKEKIKSLMRLYSKAYKIIGCVVAVLGICVIPFLGYIVGNVSYIHENLILLYCLFLLNSSLSYFFVYKKSLIIADQKNYVVEIYQEVFHAAQIILQSIFLIVTKEFIPYLLINILITLSNNVFMAVKADKMYPYLKDREVVPLTKEETNLIFTNVKALVVYKVGGIILESTDSIFISSIIDVITVGLYSNYKMVINIFKTIGAQIMNSIVASVGNLNATTNSEKKQKVFYQIFFVSFWFFGFTTVGLCVFLTELINVWLGSDFAIGFGAVFAACVYYFVSNVHYPCYTYRTTAGLFIYGKFVPICCSILNIILDFVLGIKFGLAGILWASTISRVVTYELIDPFIVYKRVFNANVLMYFLKYFGYCALILIDGIVSFELTRLITVDGFFGLIVRAAVLTVIFNVMFLLETFRTREFRETYSRIKQIFTVRRK